MRCLLTAVMVNLAAASSAFAATLSITPDAMTYQVGDTITLSVFGDPMGETAVVLYGPLTFDGALASHLSSSQTGVPTDFGNTFITFPLDGGPGFAEAFEQVAPDGSGSPGLGPLVATVLLEATGVGTLAVSWLTGLNQLQFFGLTDAPGTVVEIVPEPTSGLLLGLGLSLVCLTKCRRSRI